MKNFLKFIIGWPLTLVAFFFIGRLIFSNLGSVSESLLHINFLFLSFSIFFFILYFFIRVLFWKILLHLQGHELSFKEIAYRWGFSEIKRYIPGNIWSFLSRAESFGEKHVKRGTVFSAFAIEAQFIFLACLFLSLLSLPFILSFLLVSPIIKNFLFYLIIFAIVIFSLIILGNHFLFSRLIKGNMFGILKKIFPHFSFLDNSYLLTLNLIAMFFFGLATYCSICSLLFTSLPFWTFVGFSVFSLLVGYASIITPMGLGVREGIMTAGLAKVTTVSLAGFVSIFSRLIFIFSELVFLIISFMWYRGYLLFRIRQK